MGKDQKMVQIFKNRKDSPILSRIDFRLKRCFAQNFALTLTRNLPERPRWLTDKNAQGHNMLSRMRSLNLMLPI